LQRAAVGLEFVAQLFAVADEAVSAAREALTIDLIPVAQSRLHHTVSAIDLQDEPVDVGHQLFVDFREVRGDDAAEQQPTQTGCRVDGQNQMAEREASRG